MTDERTKALEEALKTLTALTRFELRGMPNENHVVWINALKKADDALASAPAPAQDGWENIWEKAAEMAETRAFDLTGEARTQVRDLALSYHMRAKMPAPQPDTAALVEALRKAEDGDALQILANYRAIRRQALAAHKAKP